MTDVTITDHHEEHTAGVREQVPIAELTQFFSRAFSETMAALQSQGVRPAGPPFGKYYGTPTTIVDVEAGFPVATVITTVGNVAPGTLPGGKVVEAIHVGPYDTMEQTYAEMERHFEEAGLTRGDVMWESYLSDPQTQPDPAGWRTRICWLVG
jgi:effector-binding domain-containing protein